MTSLDSLLDAAALLVTAAAFVAASTALLVTRRWRVALAVLLDLLTAAGLLRLAQPPDLGRLAAAAAVLAVRRLAVAGLRPAGRHGR